MFCDPPHAFQKTVCPRAASRTESQSFGFGSAENAFDMASVVVSNVADTVEIILFIAGKPSKQPQMRQQTKRRALIALKPSKHKQKKFTKLCLLTL